MNILKRITALLVFLGNGYAWVIILRSASGNTFDRNGFLLSALAIFSTYMVGLFNMVFQPKHTVKEYRLNTAPLAFAEKKSGWETQVYGTYQVVDPRVSVEDWKGFKTVLKTYADQFLMEYYPGVSKTFDLRLLDQNLDPNINGQHLQTYSYFGENEIYIYLSDFLVDACLHYDDASFVLPTFYHELVHYALFQLGKESHDGQEGFEKELDRIGLPSNYHQNFTGAYVSRKEEDGQTIATVYISKTNHSKVSLGMKSLV